MRIKIAENIKKFRIASGYTQSELAILLSVSPQAVSRWENGQAFPDITLLPLLAKYLNVTIDEIMGSEEQRGECLKKEAFERKMANIDDESERAKNELRILEIYEELAHTELPYLINYFRHLMNIKAHERFILNDLESRIESARQMIRDRLKISNMRDRVTLLSTVAAFEDEKNLTRWADEYQLPEYIRANFWDELLLTRYTREQNVNKLSEQNQKILYEHIKNTIYYLTDSVHGDMRAQGTEFSDLERYKTAFDTLSLYSTQVDDVFIFVRIIAEVRYAETLLMNGCIEESLLSFALATEHLSVLHQIPNGSVLYGSVSSLSSFHLVINGMDKLEKCVFNLGGYDKNPIFDKIRTDKRFIKYEETQKKFLPQRNCRSWVNENGSDTLDAKWEMLLSRAKKDADELSNGNTVVMLTAKGTVYSVSLQNGHSAIEAEGVIKLFIEKKKNSDAKIERLICMWHDGSIDLPSCAFREALVSAEASNLSAKMLLSGLNGYVVKTIKASMPEGYEKKFFYY